MNRIENKLINFLNRSTYQLYSRQVGKSQRFIHIDGDIQIIYVTLVGDGISEYILTRSFSEKLRDDIERMLYNKIYIAITW